MNYLHTLLLLSCMVTCFAEFADYMQVYEEQCLGEDKMHCADGSCVWRHQHCDGKVDCPDGSDENFCLDHTPEPTLCNETHQYMCKDQKKCIPNIWLCNNQTECVDGSDELNCRDEPNDQPGSSCNGFKCVSDDRCISLLWACDGKYDCTDRSDENIDTCRNFRYHRYTKDYCMFPGMSVIYGEMMYPCLDGSRCIPLQFMCNGMQDCRDGSDEGDFCKNWTTLCSEDLCNTAIANATCYPNRDGHHCECDRRYTAYNASAKECQPFNMCDLPWPECSQFCENRNASYFCKCEEGYVSDRLHINHVCIAPDPEAMLFISTGNEIKYFTMRSKKLVTVAKVKQAHGVSYDGQFVYWVETAQGHQAIVRAELNNVAETKQVIVSLGLEDPGDLAVDWMGGHIYFGDAQRKHIAVCRVDGSMCTTLKTNAKLPKFLTLDARKGKMYWADWHERPVIMTARMDGSESSVLVDGLYSFATGLAIDPPGGRLYYLDRDLRGARLDDGRTFTATDTRMHNPYAITVFENIIYWSDWATNTIQMLHKGSWANIGVLVTLNSSIYGLHMYHPILMKTANNPCSKHSCSHLCLLTSNSTSVCACPEGMELIKGTEICQHVKGFRPEHLVVGGGATFTKIQYNSLGNPETHATNMDIGRVQAMAYDSLRDTLYIYDGQRKFINYVSMSEFSRGVTRLFLYRGFDNVVDMDYDYITDSLYIVDAGRRFIEVVSLRTKKRALVHRFDSEMPVSICVMPEYGKMLVAVTESDQNNNIHIDSFGLDGSGRQHILMNDLKGPHINLRYSQVMDNVYLADEGNSIIDHMHPQGTGRENYRELSTSVTDLAVTDTLVFWTDRRSSRLYWADIHESSRNIRRIEFSIFPNSSQLHIQSTSQPSIIPKHPCQNKPCSDICVQVPRKESFPFGPSQFFASSEAPEDHKQYKCLCPPGLMNIDGNCTALVLCKEEEAYCHSSNVCIRKSALCDGNKDCLHGEDEEGCAYLPISNTTCSVHEILCNDRCIDRNRVCAATTTSTTSAPNTCSSSQYDCGHDGVCIERAQMCDGIADCSDASDEAYGLCSTLNCLHTEFMCSSGRCVLNSFKCDGEWDCQDGSDEIDCENKTCAQGFFQCRNLECIDVKKRCNIEMDCADNSDEEDCDEPNIFENKEEVENCAEWEYTCERNRSICLPLTARCNGQQDCPGNSDEANCELWNNSCIKHGMFLCIQENICVSASEVCDGHKNCAEGADESADACRLVNKTSRLYPGPVFPREECRDGFQCNNGQCVEWRAVCDHQPDCFDGSDEGDRCSTACQKNTCSHTCQATPAGARCRCPPGYELSVNITTCEDEDECARDVCSQHCYNTVGSFVCSCHRGYALRSDRRSCKAIKGNMSVLYVTGNSVRSITADGRVSLEYNDRNVGSITDMDYDVRRQKLYVTSAEAGQVIEVNSTKSEVVITNIGRPTRVAVDWVTGNVYFIDSTPADSHVRVCHVPRKRCARLQKLTLDSIVTALVIDPASRKMFYCVTRDLESIIWSASLSGRHATHIAVVQNCTGLAVDTFKNRLYVAETGPAHIVSMDYDGNLFKQVLTNDPHLQAPHDLAIFEDHLYFLVANSFKLSRCVLFGQKHCELYLQRVFNANTFVIRHESVQRDDIPDYCENIHCSNVCVREDVHPLCLCDDGSLSKDGSCPLVVQSELPLFNGWTFQDYKSAYQLTSTLLTTFGVLFVVYLSLFLIYHFYWRKRGERSANYIPNYRVRFRNTTAESSDEGLSPVTTPEVQMAEPGSSRHEYLNPMQFLKNWRQSFRKPTRPVGTAGLSINIPRTDASDTESDLDERENKRIIEQ